MRNFIAIITVILFGAVLLFTGTNGFKAFTAEKARTMQLINEQPLFPSITLEDNKSRTFTFDKWKGKLVIATFMYTSCGDVCPVLEMNLSKVYHNIPDEYLGKEIVFISVSFDPKRDTPARLNQYRHHFGSDGETWRMARVPDEQELKHLLEKLDIIVIPDGNGGFVHNSAFYLFNEKGNLIDIMDYTDPDKALTKVMSILTS